MWIFLGGSAINKVRLLLNIFRKCMIHEDTVSMNHHNEQEHTVSLSSSLNIWLLALLLLTW